MSRRGLVLSLPFVLATLLIGQTQPSSPGDSQDNYLAEAAVVEQMSTKVVFDNDGNFTREQISRVRVQSDAGVQQWGLLRFPFQSSTQTVEIDFVRVHKADGSTVATPEDNIQDLDSEITRSAPFYSDLREKHVAVRGLGKGDVLEYQARWRSTKPLIPGQFWFQYNFYRDGIILNELLEVKVPANRAVKVKALAATQRVTTDADSRTYSWTYSKRQIPKESEDTAKRQTEAALGRLPSPDIQVSSFQNWGEVGRWYWGLQKERIVPTAGIRAKAAELTKGMTDDDAKILALYSFVSTHYRYIGIAFGIGRYQPHAADDVLSNNYGDCKDKQTLLASLLEASGITLYPALISTRQTLDAEVPSPAQFDHVIGYLPRGKSTLWLDTTPEVAPLGLLLPPLRNKQALVMEGGDAAHLVTAPPDPPFLSTQHFEIAGKLNNGGTLEAKIEDTSRGDAEIVVRAAFRQLPQSKWNELVQGISYALGYAGTVSDINVGSPEGVNELFHFSYSYSRKDYPDWSERRITVPGLPFLMPPVKDDAKDPVWLGPPMESVSDSKVEFPNSYKPQIPTDVDLKYSFAEYHATYSEEKGVLLAKRRLLIKQHEVAVADLQDYRNFVKSLQNDVNRYVEVSSSAAPANASSPAAGPMASVVSGIRDLPDSKSSEANRLEAEARSAISTGDRSAALDGFSRAVRVDPEFSRAWVELATANRQFGKVDPALEAMRKAIASDPKQVVILKMYAYMLNGLNRSEAAMGAWHDVLKIAPQDWEANTALGSLLMDQKKYDLALPYFEAASIVDPSPAAQNRLGVAYLKAGQSEKGLSILEKVVAADPKPENLNNVAYEIAESQGDLSKALDYARQAVNRQEKESVDISLATLIPDDLRCTDKIGMFWDTLGWVYFRLGQLDRAESYLSAAWLLSQNALVGGHLGQIYEEQHKTENAVHMYRLALAAGPAAALAPSSVETRQHLEHLTGKPDSKIVPPARNDTYAAEVSQLRTVKLQRLVPGEATAEFFLLFTPGPNVSDAKFVSGSEKLRSATAVLSKTKFKVAFPEGSSARLVRRAILMCSPVSGCEVALFTPNSVRSVE